MPKSLLKGYCTLSRQHTTCLSFEPHLSLSNLLCSGPRILFQKESKEKSTREGVAIMLPLFLLASFKCVYSTVQHGRAQHRTTVYNTVLYGTVWYSTVQGSTVQHQRSLVR